MKSLHGTYLKLLGMWETFLTIWMTKCIIGALDITDENLPLKKMRERAKAVPYMTANWMNAIRSKRRALANYQNDKSDSNWDELRKWHNKATLQNGMAIKSYWKGKSDHLKQNPADFYRTFMPSLISKLVMKLSRIKAG